MRWKLTLMCAALVGVALAKALLPTREAPQHRHGQRRPQNRLFMQPNLPRSASQGYAFFEFAPASGAGMGPACACTTPTGARGEALTFTRASSGTCLKGNTLTGIANGDMVTCSTDQPRVMPGGDGSGGLGLLVEGARTNVALRSQEFDNAAVWVPSSSVVALPTITANAGTAPDGTATAERVQLPAVSSGWSLVQQLSLGGAGTYTGSVYARGNGQSGTFVMLIGSLCQTCSYTNGSWSACVKTQAIGGASTFSFGQDVTDCGGGPFGTQDFFLWGGQFELGSFASSYIATAGASATRANEVVAMSSVPIVGATTAAGSSAATIVPQWSTSVAPADALALGGDNTLEFPIVEASGANRIALYDGTTIVRTTGDFTANVAARLSCSWSGSTMTIANATAGTSGSGSFDGAMASSILNIGTLNGSFPLHGVVKQVCLDPSPARCR